MKKFINRPENAVEEMLEGLVVLSPGLARLAGHKVLIRADAERVRDKQVAIISGGGSGHEPAHAGYVGEGMLSAGVAGEVFTSPDTDSIHAAIRAVAGKAGALLVVKNYTGDRLNFGLAAEMARSEGIPVEMIIVDDDVALDNKTQFAGSRGLAGTVFIHKLVGGAAAEGKSLAEVAAVGRGAIKSLATMGVSFSAGTSPAVGKPSFELGEDEMELGLGIHGEPGVTRARMQPADELTETLLNQILKRGIFGNDRRVALMINNLGATTAMELAIVARHAMTMLEKKGYTVERMYAGTLLSSLDMAGISISVLGVDDAMLRWLDAPTSAPAWPNAAKQRPGKVDAQLAARAVARESLAGVKNAKTETGRKIKRAIEAACRTLIEAEGDLTEMDRIVGDGDLGASMKRAATAVQEAVDTYPLDEAPATLKALAQTLRSALGGSSGPLYGVFFLRCGNVLENSGWTSLAQWAKAIEKGVEAISELGGAKHGDRTMLDALYPFVAALKGAGANASREVLEAAVEEAKRGAEATAQMTPRLGRSSYLGDRVIGHVDPGAMAVALWLGAVVEALFAEEAPQGRAKVKGV
ncbi:MAG TPA: dihydroxyacetone kinase subunit DhaL [Candidatus Acidoferrum sp.]|nr:dihydroxyacetone kinase subunit DhaL [Candidatus Acidoferrum sp.]